MTGRPVPVGASRRADRDAAYAGRDLMLSFVVPAYDEEDCLPATLKALHAAAAQAAVPYEIVVADDASRDATPTLAVAGGARVVTVSHRQIAATRNSGANAAKGDLLFFVDADTVLPGPVLRAALSALAGGAAGGGAAVRFDEPVPLAYRLTLPVFVRVYRAAGFAAGCAIFCTRRAFEAAGGFDETLYGGEEILFSRALRRQGKFVLLREPVVTSGRKMRAYRPGEMLWLMVRLAARGFASVRDRRGLDLWYGERRPDPAKAAERGRSS